MSRWILADHYYAKPTSKGSSINKTVPMRRLSLVASQGRIDSLREDMDCHSSHYDLCVMRCILPQGIQRIQRLASQGYDVLLSRQYQESQQRFDKQPPHATRYSRALRGPPRPRKNKGFSQENSCVMEICPGSRHAHAWSAGAHIGHRIFVCVVEKGNLNNLRNFFPPSGLRSRLFRKRERHAGCSPGSLPDAKAGMVA